MQEFYRHPQKEQRKQDRLKNKHDDQPDRVLRKVFDRILHGFHVLIDLYRIEYRLKIIAQPLEPRKLSGFPAVISGLLVDLMDGLLGFGQL